MEIVEYQQPCNVASGRKRSQGGKYVFSYKSIKFMFNLGSVDFQKYGFSFKIKPLIVIGEHSESER